MIGDWTNHWWLETPEGTLDFNTDLTIDDGEGLRFQLVPQKCNANLPVRVTADDVPQGDGAIPHRRWRSGFSVHLAVEMLKRVPGGGDEDLEAACDEDLVTMLDLLGLHINAMIRTGLVSGFPNARLFFTPSGFADRMFDRCQLQTGGSVSLSDGDIGPVVEFDLDTPYPYYIEATETQTMLAGTGIEVVTNAGNTEYFPVVEIYGDMGGSTYIELINNSIVDLDGNPLRLVYFSALPGAVAITDPDYVEFTFFTGTAFLNGSGANRLAGLDFRYSDFFPLIPGDNFVEIVGATALIKSNGAFA